jgi:hypothetical protein
MPIIAVSLAHEWLIPAALAKATAIRNNADADFFILGASSKIYVLSEIIQHIQNSILRTGCSM